MTKNCEALMTMGMVFTSAGGIILLNTRSCQDITLVVGFSFTGLTWCLKHSPDCAETWDFIRGLFVASVFEKFLHIFHTKAKAANITSPSVMCSNSIGLGIISYPLKNLWVLVDNSKSSRSRLSFI